MPSLSDHLNIHYISKVYIKITSSIIFYRYINTSISEGDKLYNGTGVQKYVCNNKIVHCIHIYIHIFLHGVCNTVYM